MTLIDVVDELFVVAAPEVVAAQLAGGPPRWRQLWPDLDLEVVADRGAAGMRWTATGALVGSMEVWLEPVLDGTLLHYYLRADLPPGRRAGRRRVTAEIRRRQRAAKAVAFAIKDRLEAGRAPGAPAAPARGS
ncbi:MAG: polyketide cyclase / dehydrase and lipid transport [Pseudonocardia sp.]